jgi:hypothetical protein
MANNQPSMDIRQYNMQLSSWVMVSSLEPHCPDGSDAQCVITRPAATAMVRFLSMLFVQLRIAIRALLRRRQLIAEGNRRKT